MKHPRPLFSLALASAMAQARHAGALPHRELDERIKRAEAAGCIVTRNGDEVTITVPDGVDFDLRTLK